MSFFSTTGSSLFEGERQSLKFVKLTQESFYWDANVQWLQKYREISLQLIAFIRMPFPGFLTVK